MSVATSYQIVSNHKMRAQHDYEEIKCMYVHDSETYRLEDLYLVARDTRAFGPPHASEVRLMFVSYLPMDRAHVLVQSEMVNKHNM